MSNKNNKVIYIGVTNDIARRIYEHKAGIIEGFTKKYNVHKSVYFETFGDIKAAIARKKQLKGWIRAKKNDLVERLNPEWEEISPTGFFDSTSFRSE